MTFFSPNSRKACLQMRNGREVACKVEDTGERGVSWKTRRIEIQSSHKGTGLDRKTKDRKDGCKLYKECGYDSKIIREFPYDDGLPWWLSW